MEESDSNPLGLTQEEFEVLCAIAEGKPPTFDVVALHRLNELSLLASQEHARALREAGLWEGGNIKLSLKGLEVFAQMSGWKDGRS